MAALDIDETMAQFRRCHALARGIKSDLRQHPTAEFGPTEELARMLDDEMERLFGILYTAQEGQG